MKKSIARRTLLQMGLRICLVTTVVTIASYYQIRSGIEERTRAHIKRFMAERGDRENLLFEGTVRHHRMMTSEFLRVYKSYLHNPQTSEMFLHLLKKNSQGVWRNRDSYSNGKKDSGIFLAKSNPNRELRARVLAALRVVDRFGLPYRDVYQDLYFTFPENGIVLYWPEFPRWTKDIKDNFDLTKEEYFQISTPQMDPAHATQWTGLFYDQVSDKWMVTASTPIYVGNQHIATVHHDMMVNEIFDRMVNPRLSGANSYFIVRSDGRLVMHPSYMELIKKSHGQIKVDQIGDKHLLAEFNKIKGMKSQTDVLTSVSGKDYLAVTEINGPSWYLVTSYPYRPVQRAAEQGALFILMGGLVSLFTEIFFLFFVLQRQIANPLLVLVKATKKVTFGRFSRIEFQDEGDEVADLARAFNKMVDTIKERDLQLACHNQNLEKLIEARTQELDQQKALNLQASKMSALGEMAGGLAHEINTPLATIQLLATQLIREIDGDVPDLEKLTQQLKSIEFTCDRAAKIIKGLKTFARDGSQDPFERTSAAQMIRESIDLCVEQLKRHQIELRLNIPAEDIYVHCRPVQICQVLLNLIGNAKDAVEAATEKWIEVHLVASDESVEIRVTDSGKGIEKSQVEKIFQPFYTTKGVGQGTGMGLSISLGIIKGHQGRLYVDESQKHTCFVVSLPRAGVDEVILRPAA